MNYYSTNRKTGLRSFKEAVIEGLPADNGLFMPEYIPKLPASFFKDLYSKSVQEIAVEVATPFVNDCIEEKALYNIISNVLNFDIPIVQVHDSIYSLELFHGPTLAFKDVGARFLAQCLGYFSGEKVTVLVATSGDTGSAVAHGFLGVENVDVVILYPSGKVSPLQEKQLTTLGQNIQAVEVNGNFDDCQQLVKTAFLDQELKKEVQLTSANSINIARLLPQSFYYFWAIAQLKETNQPIYVSVPSGNYGNLTAGLMAKDMGLPISRFIASSNRNDIVPNYLDSGLFEPKSSISTISNAMDVGNPSNFSRLTELYNNDWKTIIKDIVGYSFSDDETRQTILDVYHKHQYLLDPHGAVGYMGLKNHMKKQNGIGIFLETAHPAKFKEVVEPLVGKIQVPERLSQYLKKDKQSIKMQNNYAALKELLVK